MQEYKDPESKDRQIARYFRVMLNQGFDKNFSMRTTIKNMKTSRASIYRYCKKFQINTK